LVALMAGNAAVAWLNAGHGYPGNAGLQAAHLTLFAAASGLWLWMMVRRIGDGEVAAGAKEGSGVWILWGAALLLRALALCSPPMTSNDWVRYLWDAEVTGALGSPYGVAPASAALEWLRESRLWPLLHHVDLPGVYPPLAQLGFLVGHAMGADTPWGLKAVFGGAELVGLVGLWHAFRRGWVSGSAVVAWAWCPLVAEEVWAQGHVDGLALPLLLGFSLGLRRSPVMSGACLALAALVKPVAAVLSLIYLRRFGVRWAVVAGGLGLGAGAAAYGLLWPSEADSLGHGLGLVLAGMREYGRHWVFNPGLPGLLEWVWWGRYAAAAAVLLAVSGIAWRMGRDAPGEAAECTELVYLLGSRTVYPWYSLWLLPLACGGALRVSSMLMLATAFMGHAVLVVYAATGQWELPLMAALATHTPAAAALIWQLWSPRRPAPP
jgi:hypothetical protein